MYQLGYLSTSPISATLSIHEGINTLLRLRYEKLRGFFEVCRLITHDSGKCLIQNVGEEQHSDGDDDDYENQVDEQINQGILINEIIEEPNGQQQTNGKFQNGGQSLPPHDEEALAPGEGQNMLSGELNMNELFNPCHETAVGQTNIALRSAQDQHNQGDSNAMEELYQIHQDGESSSRGLRNHKHQKGEDIEEDGIKEKELKGMSVVNSSSITQIHGTVGLKPPESP